MVTELKKHVRELEGNVRRCLSRQGLAINSQTNISRNKQTPYKGKRKLGSENLSLTHSVTHTTHKKPHPTLQQERIPEDGIQMKPVL